MSNSDSEAGQDCGMPMVHGNPSVLQTDSHINSFALQIRWRADGRDSPGMDSHLRGTLETPISLILMVHHIVLYKLKSEVTPARVEAMMMNARMQLLKIPEVLSIKCGKRIDPESDWPFFIAIDFESMDKYAIFREDSIFVKFNEEVIKPNTSDSLTLDFEMDPGKDVRFS